MRVEGLAVFPCERNPRGQSDQSVFTLHVLPPAVISFPGAKTTTLSI